jgi:hypothetical protein
MGFDLLLAGGPDNRLFSDDLLSCLAEVRVEQTLDEPTRFAVRFQDDIEDGKLKKAGLAELQLGQLVAIAVDRGEGKYACLCRGPILEQEGQMTRGGPGSSFTVMGPDRRDELAREVRTQNWSGRASDVARLLLAPVYPLAEVDQTEELYDLNGNSLPQRASDLEFLTNTAADNGLHFWIVYSGTAELPPANLSVTETANWKASPPLQTGLPAGVPPVLPLSKDALTLRYNVPRDQCPNLTRFALATDGARPSAASTQSRNVSDGGADPIETMDQTAPLGGQGEGLATRAPARRAMPRPQSGASHTRRRSEAALRDAGFFVSAEISTTRHLLKGILEPHQVVAVEGIGGANGRTPFRVKSVTHVINGIGHFMDAVIETNVQIPGS